MKKNIGVIGGGIIGLSLAYKLLLKHPKSKIYLFEKENNIGTHQSGRNSGVLHSGLYYKPNSLKAKLAVSGIKEMINFCRDNNIKHEICGKIIIANNPLEEKQLDNLFKRGKRNGLSNLTFLNKESLKKREPNVKSNKTLLVPQEGIVDYGEVMRVMEKKIMSLGGNIYYNTKIKKIKSNKKILIKSDNNEWELDIIVNATGLFSDRTYENFTYNKSPVKIIPFRGEYYKLKSDYEDVFNHLIYPTPNPKYPFLGVHFTRFMNQSKEVGPSAVLAFKREGYNLTDFSCSDFIENYGYVGLRKFLFSNLKFSLKELSMSISKELFIKNAQKMIPEISSNMFCKGISGVRAQAMNVNGDLVMDFKVIAQENQVHILNAPSPGATASLSIASYIVDNYIK
jgi:L-2-hydroxyglutarate oxidase